MFDEIFNRKREENIDLTKYIKGKLPYLIHVAGTNGKGSTCSYLECVLMGKYKVGKFTSPHLFSPNERITINQKQISNKEFFSYYDKFKHLKIGFFDFLFLIAMNYFIDNQVDIAIIEVGIGGKYDSTNCLNYDVALITNVSYDHTNMLGNSIESIAFQKAGICKNNTLTFYTHNIKCLKDEIEKLTNNSKYITGTDKFKLPLSGKFQESNFALAYEVFKLFNLSDEFIQNGLKKFKLRGRQEKIRDNVYIDISHNEASFLALKENFKNYDNLHIFLTSLLDKDIKSIYKIASSFAKKVSVYPMPHIKRGRSKQNIIETLGNVDIIDDIYIDENCINIYCGSFYFISEIYDKLIIKNETYISHKSKYSN
ncbi:bifunctional folylpolyglutamate synthase/dihydrofolate synthase [Caviibacter abscessus]|uniref:bifunctional folylpolyglutamate synthase/dihydrofolate synthase n=1 Tax=Caviibacter abscessus TaxID=1766719 RepID=UPI0008375B4D|nr:Mur ligase family protein [Caviibacter abscessus]